MNYNLFLDDVRGPEDAFNYMHLPVFNLADWIIVRNYYAFITLIEKKGMPEIIAFDHDLGGEIEKWKNIDGYEGVYKVSDLGRVIRVKKCKGTPGDNILSPMKNESGLFVTLRNQGNDIRKTIHRLVGEAFIPNLDNKPQINHKDGNRWNNARSNLEWSTQSENMIHSHNELERDFTAYGENHSNSSSVSQYNKNNELIDVYGSVNEAGRQLKISFSNIAKCARGERNTAGGFIWKYENKSPTVDSEIKYIPKIDKKYSEKFFIPDTFTEKTGYHCAKWLIDYCMDNNEELPKEIIIHSMNPYGSRNIKSLFDTYIKVYNLEHSAIKILASHMR